MSFLSFNFAIFLGVALLTFHVCPGRWRGSLLLAFSYLFYLSWSAWHTFLLIVVTAGVYGTALWIERRQTEKGKKAIIALGLMAMLVVMFAFKAGSTLSRQYGAVALLIAPLGLSYYSFKMIGYLLDVYWETLPAQRSFRKVALYGAFFPQIVSGPIQRAEDFFNQVDTLASPVACQFVLGMRRILFGLAKKVIVADNLAILVGSVHADPSTFSALELLLGAYCFSIQLYTDFSGITDIAIGIGLLFGVKAPENFDLPYWAPNIQLFWRRMHMSLTSWLTDYLFTPVRMSLRRFGTTGLWVAITINTVAIGVWHGLTWTFLVFGLIHAIYVIASVRTQKARQKYFAEKPKLALLRKYWMPLLTFHLVVFSHIFFRAETFRSALVFVRSLVLGATATGISPLRFDPALVGVPASTLACCLLGFFASELVTWTVKNERRSAWLLSAPAYLRMTVYCAVAFAVLLTFKGTVTFIYARF